MSKYLDILDISEQLSIALRSLYKSNNYNQYKMSKFEEYDLYSKNKSFLVSENIITFTDTTGKLMALKPDVTLSIVKNNRDINDIARLYYDENVYRVSKGTGSFKEIKQVGLECLGNVASENVSEVLTLAAQSLEIINSNYVLDISNLDILTEIISEITEDSETVKNILKCVGEKNTHEIDKICIENDIPVSKTDKLKKLITLYGSADEILPEVEKLVGDNNESLISLKEVINKIDNKYLGQIKIDFSIVSNINYYNGIAFNGFVKGAPDSVLSGGQYDKLMQKMKRSQKAVGFAVYLDMVERFTDFKGLED